MVHKSSVPLYWRLQEAKYRLVGSRCKNCGSLYYPPKTLCPQCRSRGEIEDYEFSGKGKILSHTTIRTAPEGFEKEVPYPVAIIQLKEGPKVAGQVVDSRERVESGKKVKAVFRKVYEDGPSGVIHYGLKWKLVE